MPRNNWLLIIGMAVNITGSSIIWPLNTIFIHDHLGASLTFSGFLLMLYNAAGILGNLVGGSLYDRLGGYKVVLVGAAISCLATFLLTAFHSLYPYAILLIIIGFGSSLMFPAMYAMAGANWPEGGRRAYNSLYVAQNLGVAIGASLGGFLAAISFTLSFFVNAVLYLLFLALVFVCYRGMDRHSKEKDVHISNVFDQKKQRIKQKAPFYALMWVSVAFFLSWIAYVQWQSTIASYTQQLGLSLNRYSLLWTLNGLIIVIGQPLLKQVTKRIHSLKIQMAIGICLFVSSYLILLRVQHFQGFAIAMMVLTLGEMFVWPAVPTIANELAPKSRIGFYQGFVNSTATAGRMVGPLVGGLIVDQASIHLLFLALILLYIVAGLIAYFYDFPLYLEKKRAKSETKAFNLRNT
ncbi:MFS transporter [Pullulanibacillus sp. KACC 23026]|uniref:MDR family MFS transporter n=1 Tax=Pullulanibacillus sp. KACC 23026 TaxID=3028315 RepID=UPI0023AEC9F1|nr:MFS transporter [Pullulanibacillus sp. KACC 23026]WEG13848.1 MFS transporter [Pullulanibacillus sp. KACC 23026]